ncbi:hypothetical protein Bbelb_226810 [Branchiostoma belcheri]|nr:hypothetical protein Bbelb_226810 [Branchiostoma belcheri]
MGAETEPKTPRGKTPTTKPWNINLARIPIDETLVFDFEDAEKSRMCGLKLRTSHLDKWIQAHKDNFDKNFENNKGTTVTWKTTPGTTSLSVNSSTSRKTGKGILSVHFYHKKSGLMVQGQKTKWWADILYPEMKNNLDIDKRTRSSAKDGAQRIRDAVNSFQAICDEQSTPATPRQTNVIETPIMSKPTFPRTLDGFGSSNDRSFTEQLQQDLENGAQSPDDAITGDLHDPPGSPPTAEKTAATDKERGPQKVTGTSNSPVTECLERVAAVEKSIKVSDGAFSDLQRQYVDTIGKLNTFRDELIMKEKERERTHAQTLNTIATQIEAAQKSLETHIRKTTTKLQSDLDKSIKDMALQRENHKKEKDEATREISIERNLWKERFHVDRSKELEQKIASCHCCTTKGHDNKIIHDNDGSTSQNNIAAQNNVGSTSQNIVPDATNPKNNKPAIVPDGQTSGANVNTSSSVNSHTLSTGNSNVGSKNVGVRIFADSLFRDVDPERVFKGNPTKIHRSSTIKAAIDNISNMNDATTETVILHVGSNDLDNSKGHPNSVHDTLRNTDKLIETTKKAFPKARVAVSQVLQRGPNHKSPLNENIKTYNQEVLKLSKTSGFTYIKHRKLTQDRRLYLPDQLHLDPRSGTKLLVADVKRTLTSQTTPSAGPSQLPTARPEHEHRPFGQHAQPRYQPTNSRRDNAIPTRSWNRGQPFKNSANAVPLGTRNPLSQPAIGNQTAVSRATTSTIKLRSPIASTKQSALPWRQIRSRLSKAWDILTA